MKEFLKGLWHSFPVQLVFLHFRKYQVLLVFWFIIGSAINGSFMNTFGADALFLAPEYLGNVNAVSSAITGIAMGIFIMSWQITTFVLHSKHFKFLATTSKPFLKYCINNSIFPILFLLFYCYKAVHFDKVRELMSLGEILVLIAGFLVGFILLVAISFSWFFGAERTMMRSMHPIMNEPHKYIGHFGIAGNHHHEKGLIHVEWFYNTRLKLKKPRNISHYSQEFVETMFRRHHFAAVMAIILAFLFLALVGMFQDVDVFKLPAAAGILILFSILMAGAASLVYWLKSWSIPAAVLIIFLVDAMFRYEWIDTRNKAYGLNYDAVDTRPAYQRDSILALCDVKQMEADKLAMIRVLDRWKARQDSAKPVMYILNFSGGGTRSATFTLNVLQQLDSMMKGKLMQKTFMMTGASGGMLGATYYRELYRQRMNGKNLNPADPVHVERISRDLLNPLFSSMVTRDVFAPAQRFKVGNYSYVKDRAYAFEEQLNENTGGLLDIQIRDYAADETAGKVPLLMFASTVSSDGRKMLLSTQPISFMMRNWPDSASGVPGEPDAIDFASFFRKQDPYNLRLLTAMRINATFPYVLPNVWLPSQPVVDVMDAGIRDNYGQETSIRFLNVFNEWLTNNTSGVVFIQIRDRKNGAEWNEQGEAGGEGFTSMFTKPITVIQLNWMRMQDYYHDELVSMADDRFSFPFEKLTFSYVPTRKDQAAALNFHLTNKEKADIQAALKSAENIQSFKLATSY
jgi:hypothetical protein